MKGILVSGVVCFALGSWVGDDLLEMMQGEPEILYHEVMSKAEQIALAERLSNAVQRVLNEAEVPAVYAGRSCESKLDFMDDGYRVRVMFDGVVGAVVLFDKEENVEFFEWEL